MIAMKKKTLREPEMKLLVSKRNPDTLLKLSRKKIIQRIHVYSFETVLLKYFLKIYFYKEDKYQQNYRM